MLGKGRIDCTGGKHRRLEHGHEHGALERASGSAGLATVSGCGRIDRQQQGQLALVDLIYAEYGRNHRLGPGDVHPPDYEPSHCGTLSSAPGVAAQ